MELDVLNIIFEDGIMSGIGSFPVALVILIFACLFLMVAVIRVEPLYAVPVAILPFLIIGFYGIIDIPYLRDAGVIILGFLLGFALYRLFVQK